VQEVKFLQTDALIELISAAYEGMLRPKSYLEFDEIAGDDYPINAFGKMTLKEYIENVLGTSERSRLRCDDLAMAAMYLSAPAYVYILPSLMIDAIINDCPESPSLVPLLTRAEELNAIMTSTQLDAVIKYIDHFKGAVYEDEHVRLWENLRKHPK